MNVPVLSHRSVGYGHKSFVRQTLIEELADRAKTDPIGYRLKLLNKDPYKSRAVLTLLSGLPLNHFRAVAASS